jgi:hypothetical protein
VADEYFIGLDLGQTADPSAAAVLQRQPPEAKPSYHVRLMKRFPLGTPYTSIVTDMVKLCNTAPFKDACQLVVDQTGVGRPVVDMFRAAASMPRVVPVTITGGHTATFREEDRSFHVPKKDLVGCLQVLLQARRLLVAADLRDAELLVKELGNFRVKITAAANETFGAWREGQHDDLVLAVALAAWLADRAPANRFDVGTSRGKTGSILDSIPSSAFS